MEAVAVIARLFLAAVFALAGIGKLVDRAGSVRSFLQFGVPMLLARPLATGLPVLELICAVALIPAASARWGAIGVLFLLVLFIAGITLNLAGGRAPDCHCFGQLHSAPVSLRTLARNVVFAGISVLVITEGADGSTSVAAASAGLIRGGTLTGGVAWLALAFAAVGLYVVFHLLRQNGRLLLRLERVEAALGITPGEQVSGLPVGSAAPAFTLRDLNDRTVTLDGLRKENRPLLLVFSEPGCAACDALLPDVARWQRELADRVSVILITSGSADEIAARRGTYELGTVLLQTDRKVAETYGVIGTPSAVVVENGRIARPMAAGPDSIRALVSDITRLRVPKGSPAPSVPLMDLDGRTIDLSKRRGRRTLLLFWNPTCGFCQQMLDEVRTREAGPQANTDVLVIATGTAEANKQQGFRSTVLLDGDFRLGDRLGITGTPSAVLLDEHGTISSDIAAGKEAVIALMRDSGDHPADKTHITETSPPTHAPN